MNVVKTLALLAVAGSLSACETGFMEVPKKDKTVDRGFDTKHLSKLEAGIWIDPQGCDHWIIDDGVEGYLSARVDKYGKPVCSGTAAPNTAVGPYKKGSAIADPSTGTAS
ncbi:hypothetical protein [Celeribacter halophilus]|uniref:Lipoprotein n=1 Tax=Celeribacter halophilus TaxID=576117 RepID=A0A1I3SBP5_9RHOB|nr:hypothetical protein [Celeribacter halophilus]PZX11570.1 hypothetical protein LX82_01861 [Celeribacter halophilus]SFJ56135.1 hypothetical protein SAMN04488138_106139 [Celeribacter halophilus]